MKAKHDLAAGLSLGEAALDTQTLPEPRLEVNPGFSFSVLSSSTGRVSKAVKLGEDGQMEKLNGGELYKGTYKRTSCVDARGFARILGTLNHNHCLCFGIANAETAPIRTKSTAGEGEIAITKEFFNWPKRGVWFIDVDEKLPDDAVLAVLYDAVPELRDAPHVIADSSSSWIWSTFGGWEIGEGSKHLFVLVEDADEIPRAGRVLVERLWLAGHMRYIESASGALLERGPVDASVWKPSRKVFASGMACIDEFYEQRRPAPRCFNNDAPPLCLAEVLPDHPPEVLARVSAIRDAARQVLRPSPAKSASVTSHGLPMAAVGLSGGLGLPPAQQAEVAPMDSQAVHFLKTCPPAVQGQHGDLTTLKTAATLKDYGLSQETAYELMRAIYNPRCVPMWSPEDLRRKVESAYRYCVGSAPGYLDLPFDAPDPQTMALVDALSASEASNKPQGTGFCFEDCSAARLIGAKFEPRPYYFAKTLPAGLTGLVVGPPSVGKSYWVLQAAVARAGGFAAPLSGVLEHADNAPGRVFYLASEDDEHILAERLNAVLDQYAPIDEFAGFPEAGAIRESVSRNLFIMSGVGKNSRLMEETRPGQYRATPFYRSLCDGLRGQGLALSVLDPLARLHSVSENDNSAMTYMVELLEGLAQASGSTLLCLHHTSKGAASKIRGRAAIEERLDAGRSRGASALQGGFRWQLSFTGLFPGESKLIGAADSPPEDFTACKVSMSNNGMAGGVRFMKRGLGGVLHAFKVGAAGADLAGLPERICEAVAMLVKKGEAMTAGVFVRRHAAAWKNDLPTLTKTKLDDAVQTLLLDGSLRTVERRNPGSKRVESVLALPDEVRQ